LLAIRWAAEQFNTESVLFREGERFGFGLWFKHLLRDREDTPNVAEALFCGVLILLIKFFMGFALRAPNLAVLALATQLVVIATPALMMTVMLTRSPRKTLLLQVPPWMALPAAALLAVGLHPVVHTLARIVNWLYPMSETMKEALSRFLQQQNQNAWLLLLVAVAPAICEELAFRGFILSGLRHIGRKWRAIAISAVFFGITHTIFQQSLVACLVGVVIGYLAVQTGSILPCMLFHALHNSLGILGMSALEKYVGKVTWLDWLVARGANGELAYRWEVVVLGGVASAAILLWFRQLPYARTPEESLEEAIQHQAAGVGVG
jgi:sodium transport system permease protein